MIRTILTAAALAATIATQAQASVFKDKFIDSMMECMSYSSKMNCDKAEGAAELYARSLRNNPAAEQCALTAQVAGGQASIIPLVPSAVSTAQAYLEQVMSECAGF